MYSHSAADESFSIRRTEQMPLASLERKAGAWFEEDMLYKIYVDM
jgi:hypothetical protein